MGCILNKLARRIIVFLEIGGGTLGIVILLSHFSHESITAIIIYVFAILYYAFGITAGILLAESNSKGVSWSKIYQLLQIPLINSPFFSYMVTSGGYICLVISTGATNIDLKAFLGSNIYISVFHGSSPWSVGVNFLGIAAFLLLRKYNKATGR
jgi:hypothetical protein